MTFIKKLILSFLIFTVLFSSSATYFFASPAKADDPGPWYSQTFPQYYTKVWEVGNEDEIFGERYTAGQVQWVFYAIPGQILTELFGAKFTICVLSGDVGSCISGAFDDVKARLESIANYFGLTSDQDNEGAMNTNQEFSLYGFFYNNSSSGIGYVLRKINRLEVVPEAQAQGFGFSTAADTVQVLWVAVRNITYALLVLAIIALSFMIMFRVKLSPQTVISVQSVLPKVIITIILITFSYAIAGLLIDLMYVVIGILSAVISSAQISTLSPVELFKDLTVDRNAFVLTWQFALVWFFAALATTVSQGFIGGILALLFTIVVIIMALFISFKIMWVLIKTYVNILLLIITSPLQILLGLLTPSGGIGPWAKSMLANLMVYPVVGMMFLLAFFFLSQSLTLIIGDLNLPDLGEFLVPFELNSGMLDTVTSWDPPLTWGTNSGRFLYMMAAFAIFALIPKVADIIKGMIEGKPLNYGMAIGEAFGPARGMAGTGAGAGVTFMGERLATRAGTAGTWKENAYRQAAGFVAKKLSG